MRARVQEGVNAANLGLEILPAQIQWSTNGVSNSMEYQRSIIGQILIGAQGGGDAKR